MDYELDHELDGGMLHDCGIISVRSAERPPCPSDFRPLSVTLLEEEVQRNVRSHEESTRSAPVRLRTAAVGATARPEPRPSHHRLTAVDGDGSPPRYRHTG